MTELLIIGVMGVLLFFFCITLPRIRKKRQGSKDKSRNFLHFKSNEDAFKYSCAYLSPPLKEKCAYVGIVAFADQTHEQHSMLLDVAANNGKILVAGFSKSNVVSPHEGDLVLWGFIEHVGSDSLSGKIGGISAYGAILAVIKPSLNLTTHQWEVGRDLTT
jgi:hypothetical protein